MSGQSHGRGAARRTSVGRGVSIPPGQLARSGVIPRVKAVNSNSQDYVRTSVPQLPTLSRGVSGLQSGSSRSSQSLPHDHSSTVPQLHTQAPVFSQTHTHPIGRPETQPNGHTHTPNQLTNQPTNSQTRPQAQSQPSTLSDLQSNTHPQNEPEDRLTVQPRILSNNVNQLVKWKGGVVTWT